MEAVYKNRRHGLTDHWLEILNKLPDYCGDAVIESDLNHAIVKLGASVKLSDNETATVKKLLLELQPWRKGPFELLGVKIDAEWRSDFKWKRLQGKIDNLQGRKILDVGCGNGYYMLRMKGAGASLVLGIDPSQLFVAQFLAIKRYYQGDDLMVLPLKMAEFPLDDLATGFDTVFSMGILYHRKNPHSHIQELYRSLRKGGQLVLETLVIDGDEIAELIPAATYSKMPNVHCIPTIAKLLEWLKQNDFYHVNVIDITHTTACEQRKTQWMKFESLCDFLQPNDTSKTIEGYPAPLRAMLTAHR